MNFAIHSWTGKTVHVTLRATVPTPLTGVLIQVDETGILLELAEGKTFVPVTSILHISLVGGE